MGSLDFLDADGHVVRAIKSSNGGKEMSRYEVLGPKEKHDAEGNTLCWICEKPIPLGRRTCGGDCRKELNIRSGVRVRFYVKQRDKEVCSHCGLDCAAVGWEAHHKAAVAEGGGQCGLDNYETVCYRCHAKETGALRKRLNAQKKGILNLESELCT
jgi:hypothetical protein